MEAVKIREILESKEQEKKRKIRKQTETQKEE